MPFLTWDEKVMTVGVRVLDNDHRAIVAMINELFYNIENKRGQKAADRIIDRLVLYMCEHFIREEGFFAQTAYPDAPAHIEEHAKMAEHVLAFQQKYKNAPTDDTVLEMANFLWNWLVDHDLTFDKKYGPYLNSKGIL